MSSSPDGGSDFDWQEYLFGGDGDPETEDDPGSVESVSPFEGTTIDVLQTFGTSPAAFIFGVILTPILSGVETAVISGLDLVNLVFFGESRATTEGMIGIADIPTISTNLVIAAGNMIGEPILTGAIGPLADSLVGLGKWAGPWGLIGAAVALAVIVNIYAGALRKSVEILLDFIPGGGAILE